MNLMTDVYKKSHLYVAIFGVYIMMIRIGLVLPRKGNAVKLSTSNRPAIVSVRYVFPQNLIGDVEPGKVPPRNYGCEVF